MAKLPDPKGPVRPRCIDVGGRWLRALLLTPATRGRLGGSLALPRAIPRLSAGAPPHPGPPPPWGRGTEERRRPRTTPGRLLSAPGTLPGPVDHAGVSR